MINLNDFVKEFEGEEYVPLKIAQAAVAETYNDDRLDQAMALIKNAVKDMNNSLNETLADD